ncbi:hypothetical protein NS365_13290 [Aureimonas ureilytica]|uniref:Uncharacterized protein n=1 Tax=Aureimonas ureilytica TaxID=401562 RepID=A0A175RQC5_9HYPH|nr:hypothetical protein [Aureimonas ureilytica]KTR04999.1 hypothetical protein NS365_13290 [Aureimonas ureilytica]
MAEIRIQGPDGSSFSFPEGTPGDVIETAMRSHYGAPKPEPQKPSNPRVQSGADAAILGALDSIPFLDEAASGIDWALDKLPGRRGRSYDELLKTNRDEFAGAQKEYPTAYLGGQIAGGVAQGVGLAGAGLSMAANAARSGAGLARTAFTSGIDGALMGGVQGVGAGEDFEGRLGGAVTGIGGGFALGSAAPYAVAGATAAAKPLIAPLMSRVRPQGFANNALSDAMRRGGVSADDVVQRLEDASSDGQMAFNVADAIGHSGRRMLSTVTRTPNDARQGVVEALEARQMEQGRRVAGAFSDASGSPMTADEYKTALENLRSTEAGINYGPVMSETAPIDVNGAVAQANSRISPLADQFARSQGAVPTDLSVRSSIEAGEAQLRDPIREALKTARSYLAGENLTASNVGQAFRAKTNLDRMIRDAADNNRGGEVEALLPVQQALDDALARTSPTYAAARDAYKTSSARVDAVGLGRKMDAGRTRVDDNLVAFEQLPDDEARAAARVGFFDPKIRAAEGKAGTGANAVRPYISESARRELPAFAAPGEGDLLMRRLGREQTMFETNHAALGNSKTADNLADQADMARFDPGAFSALLQGRPVAAAMSLVAQALNEGKGLPPPVLNRVAQALMETDPRAARAVLEAAQAKGTTNDAVRGRALAIMNALSGSGAGRLAAP